MKVFLQVDLKGGRQEIVQAGSAEWTERGDLVLYREDADGMRAVRVFLAEDRPVFRFHSRR